MVQSIRDTPLAPGGKEADYGARGLFLRSDAILYGQRDLKVSRYAYLAVCPMHLKFE